MDRILAYLEGEMNEEERKRLEMDLEEDAALKKAFDTARTTYSLLKADRRMQLQEEWTSVSKRAASPHPLRLGTFPRWVGYAVAAGILLLLLFFWQVDFLQSSSSQLALTAFAPYPAPTTLRSEADSLPPTALAIGYQKYQSRDYAGALALLDTTGLAPHQQIEVLLYRGISFMGKKDYTSARDAFGAAWQQNPKANNEVLQWYQALNYLLMDQEANARPILQQLADQSTDIYGEKANKLLLALPSTRK